MMTATAASSKFDYAWAAQPMGYLRTKTNAHVRVSSEANPSSEAESCAAISEEEREDRLAMIRADRIMPSYEDLVAMATSAEPLVDDQCEEW